MACGSHRAARLDRALQRGSRRRPLPRRAASSTGRPASDPRAGPGRRHRAITGASISAASASPPPAPKSSCPVRTSHAMFSTTPSTPHPGPLGPSRRRARRPSARRAAASSRSRPRPRQEPTSTPRRPSRAACPRPAWSSSPQCTSERNCSSASPSIGPRHMIGAVVLVEEAYPHHLQNASQKEELSASRRRAGRCGGAEDMGGSSSRTRRRRAHRPAPRARRAPRQGSPWSVDLPTPPFSDATATTRRPRIEP